MELLEILARTSDKTNYVDVDAGGILEILAEKCDQQSCLDVNTGGQPLCWDPQPAGTWHGLAH